MNQSKRSILPIITAALAVLAFTLVMARAATAMPIQNLIQLFLKTPAQSAETFAPNFYLGGKVELDYAQQGTLNDPLPAPAEDTLPDLGDIDLFIQLNMHNASNLTGYVDLEKTLVYTRANTLNIDGADVDMGPKVTGTFDGTNLTLLSEKVTVVSAERTLERQFRITGQIQGGNFIGEYRETITNYDPQPLTIVGHFEMAVSQMSFIYLPAVIR